MRRLLWLSSAATLGVLAVRRFAPAPTPSAPTPSAPSPPERASGPADRLVALGRAARDFAVDVREGMAEREAQLRGGLGLDGPGLDVLGPEGLGPDEPPRAALDAAPHRPAVPGAPADRLPLPTPRTGREA